jgi:curved DNA-binding protein CbpA
VLALELYLRSSLTKKEIKQAYRKALLLLHPDKNSAPEAPAAFHRVREAFSVLSALADSFPGAYVAKEGRLGRC